MIKLLKNYNMKQIVLVAFISLLLFSCKKNTDTIVVQPQPTTVAASTQMDVSYGTDPLQKMDVYLPANRTAATKLMIMIHGGGWSQGDKTDLNQYLDTLKRRLPTYAFININYRLAVNALTTFPTQENDVKAAINYIYSKKNEFIVSDKFVLLGASAGAHLALLQAYKYNNTVKIKAVVDFFGPTDMTAMYNDPAPLAPASSIAQLFNNDTPTTNPNAYMQSSSINYVSTASSMPTIILHGGMDPLVKPTQATALRDKLLLANIATQYVFYPSEGHGWGGAPLTDSFDKIQAFLTQYVQ